MSNRLPSLPKRRRAADSGRPPQLSVRLVSSPAGAGKPGSRVDRRPASYSQEPAGRAGRDLAGPGAGRPGAWHIPSTELGPRLRRALQRRHRRRLRHRRSDPLLGAQVRAGRPGLPPPRGGRGRPRRGAAAATRAACGACSAAVSAWRARIWFCAGIGSSSIRGMRGARNAGRSACGGMNGFSGSAGAGAASATVSTGSRNSEGFGAIGRIVTSSIATGASDRRLGDRRRHRSLGGRRSRSDAQRLRDRAMRLVGALGALRHALRVRTQALRQLGEARRRRDRLRGGRRRLHGATGATATGATAG